MAGLLAPAAKTLARPVSLAGQKWEAAPVRWQACAGMSAAFILSNVDKVNLSVAIIPMALDFGWSPTTVGLVQSAFFYGYLASQLPGGILAERLGGLSVLPAGVLTWSATGMAIPAVAANLPLMFLARGTIGLGEGVSPPAAVNIIANTFPPEERSRATALTFGGLSLGSILGLLVSPFLIQNFGWPPVFVVFGGAGLVWCLWFEASGLRGELERLSGASAAPSVLGEDGAGGPGTRRPVSPAPADAAWGGDGAEGVPDPAAETAPWGQFLAAPPMRALTFTHFCNNWGVYTMLAWLPTFYKESLDVDLAGAAFYALLPPSVAVMVTFLASTAADRAIKEGADLTTVRKVCQSVGFLGPATLLSLAIATDDPLQTVGLVTLGLGLNSFSVAGLYCNHQDLSPKYSSNLFGITNTLGSMPGIVGVPFCGWLLEQTGSWSTALFLPSIFLYLAGAGVFLKWGSAEPLELKGE